MPGIGCGKLRESLAGRWGNVRDCKKGVEGLRGWLPGRL